MNYSGWTPERNSARDERLASGLAAQEAHKARVLEQAVILNSIRPQNSNPTYSPAVNHTIGRSRPLKRGWEEEADKLLPVADAGEAAPSRSKRRKVDSNATHPVAKRPTKNGVRFKPDTVENLGSANMSKADQTKHGEEANKDHVNVESGTQESIIGYTPEELADLWAILLEPTPTVPPIQSPIPTIRAESPAAPPIQSPIPTVRVEPPVPVTSSSRQTNGQKGKPSAKNDTVIDLTDYPSAGGDINEEGWVEGWGRESSDDEGELLDSFSTTREEQAMLVHPEVAHPADEVTVQKPVVDVKGKGKERAEPPVDMHSSKAIKGTSLKAGSKRLRSEENGTICKRILLAAFCKLSEEDGRLAQHAYNQLMELQYLRAYQAGVLASHKRNLIGSGRDRVDTYC